MLLEKSGEIALERRKRLSQREKHHPVMEMTGNGSKV